MGKGTEKIDNLLESLTTEYLDSVKSSPVAVTKEKSVKKEVLPERPMSVDTMEAAFEERTPIAK